MTLREFAHTFYSPSHPHLTKSSRETLRYALNRWEEGTRNPDVQIVSASDAFDFIRHFDRLKPHTLRGYLAWPRILLRHAHELGMIGEVPRFPKIRCRQNLKPTPTAKDVGRMYAAAPLARLTWPTFEDPARFWRRWLVVSYFTGLRLADLMHRLTSDCVRDNAIVLQATKTGKLLAIPLCDVLSAAVAGANGRIFPVSNSPHLIRRELRTLATAAGISVPVTPHGLRRLSITEWTAASDAAGRIVHGCGVSGVIASYLNVLRPLQRARESLQVPPEFYGGLAEDRQLRLF